MIRKSKPIKQIITYDELKRFLMDNENDTKEDKEHILIRGGRRKTWQEKQ